MEKVAPSNEDRARPLYSIALLMSAASFLIICGFSIYSAFAGRNIFTLLYIFIAFFSVVLPALAGLRMPLWSGAFFLLIGGFISYVSWCGEAYWVLLVGVPVLIAGIAFLISAAVRER